ncbi:MAG: class I SAM-dependent methyltransferase [Deltaproteobacteria bacterium]|nr:class I SAM-dependent methyltransferase [Deltaproteobacteria bacterium]
MERHRQISSGVDLSFDHVIAPTTWKLLEDCNRSIVLDVGSGTGEFTAQLAKAAERVVAIEPAQASTVVARSVCKTMTNVRFVEAPLEDALDQLVDVRATMAVAVMSLMTAPDLRRVADALYQVLRPGGRFAAVLTHPCFWPKYWGYNDAPWFNYETETFIEAPFAISKCATEFVTTHIHRPLEQYTATFSDAGFQLERLLEPMPRDEVQALYPERWAFPRFMGLRWARVA